VGDINTKVDRASMAHSLKCVNRSWITYCGVAFQLDHRPDIGRQGKWIFKKAMEPFLPNEVMYRPKMGFAVPLASWFRGPLRARVKNAVMGPLIADTDLFDRAYLRELVQQHQAGARDYSAPLWTLLMFEAFLRNVLGEEARIDDTRVTG
jgi:asparagine synthase (glutamine-hydrolysing)